MEYGEFVKLIRDPSREFNYYYAEEKVLPQLMDDVGIPGIALALLYHEKSAFWHGIGTVSLTHTDEDENFMCVHQGWKQFTIVSPFQSHLVYQGKKG